MPHTTLNTPQTSHGLPTEIDHMDDDDDDEFFDCIDFTDDDDEQAPEDDIKNLLIKFKPLAVWNNSEDNLVEYVLPPNFGKEFLISFLKLKLILFLIYLVCSSADWIGVYNENFMGLDEYLAYEYTGTAGEKPHENERLLQINFSASIDLPLVGRFVFLYFHSTGIRGYSSMLGISEPFTVIKRCPSPRPDTID